MTGPDHRPGADSDDSPLRDDPPRRPLDRYRGFVARIPGPVPEHLPVQPTWICGNCADPWPCETKRKELLAEDMTPTELGMLMYGYLEDFLLDHGEEMRGSFDRFIAWTRTIN